MRSLLARSGCPAVLAAAAVSGLCHAQCLEGCTVIHTILGEAPGDQYGWKSNHLTDITGDGVRDFTITAPTNDGNGSDSGRIYVYDGASGAELWRATGPVIFGQLGIDVNRAGDIDDDGVMDIIAGAPGFGAGRAVVYSGADGSVIHTFFGAVSGDGFGFRVSGNGDVTLDGHPDLLVTAHRHDAAGTDSGRVYLYDGSDFSLLDDTDGESSLDLYGGGVDFVGDLDGDGRDEWVVGAKDAGATSGGRAYIYAYDGLNAVLQHTFDSPAGAIDFGYLFVDGGLDVNGDDTPDVYVGDFPANRARIYSGADFSLLHVLVGDNNGQFGLGEMVSDANADGRSDIALAAWLSSAGAFQAGKVFVYSGQTGDLLETFTHTVAGATFGFDVNGLGDVDGDGKPDYLITAAWDLAMQGVAYVIAGTAAPISDLDGDGIVGTTDLLLLLANWGPCADCNNCPADLDYDCQVGTTDLLVVLATWG